MASKYYGGKSTVGGVSIELTDNSREVLSTMANARASVLNKIGTAARDNIKRIILEKDIVDTYKLHDTMDYSVHDDESAVDVGSPRDYAAFQELGTRYIAARPFVAPGVLDNVAEYKRIAEETIAKKFE